MEYHRRLGIPRSRFDDLLDHFKKGSYGGTEYRYMPDYRKRLERGTVLIAGEVVRGFPKVPRTLVLEEGIPRYFSGDVAVEEKMDGYNTRVARIDGDVLAFTRSGIVCPFTTHKARSLLDTGFFDDHPKKVVCAEMIGPENPYTAHDYPDVDSLDVRVFDLRDRETGESVEVEERRSICDDYGFPQVTLFGVYDADDAVEEVRGTVEELDSEGREGVVMKTPDVTQQLKYTTSAANQGDLEFAFSLPFDYGQDFMFRRIIREAFQSVEWDEDGDELRERAHRLGESVLVSMVDTVETIDGGERVGERHTVSAEDGVVDELLDHLRDMGLHLSVEDDYVEDGERVVTFVKQTQSTNDKTLSYLDGKIVKE